MGALLDFFPLLKQPEYLHVLLNHWPVEGMAAGSFFLALTLGRQGKTESKGALLWLFLMSVLSILTVRTGHQGYDRVYAMSGGEAQAWLDVHAQRADQILWIYVATGLAALAGLFTLRRFPLWSRRWVWLTWILSMMALAGGGWVSHAGGQVRHSEFRNGPPSAEVSPLEVHRGE